MPLRGLRRDRLTEATLDGDNAWTSGVDYLKSIDELLSWLPSRELRANTSEPEETTEDNTPKLLVCHDFKGGYTENLFQRGYSFEFWHLIDTFIYFSHNRITIPPRGWVEAGHRRGVKVLGTLIFEWQESKPDLCQCLYQGTPYRTLSNSGQPSFAIDSARKLIQLAQEHKFDGYLLNIETDLNFIPPEEFYPGGEKERKRDEEALTAEKELCGMKAILTPGLRQLRADRMQKNAQALERWTSYIRNEGKRLVGSHFDIIWYDSVTTEGKLQWQDALTPLNAPFFLAADKLFTNYTWAQPPPPAPPGNFQSTPQTKYHPKLLQSSGTAKSLNRSPSDVFEGIDVFGRNCYGGFNISKSLDMICPASLSPLGLSVAIFAPGWTWERAKDDGTERSWNEWWNDDLRLWVGPSAPDSGLRPVGAYFGPKQRSRIRNDLEDACRPFYTNFSRGSGKAWWMSGRNVYDNSMLDDQLGRSGWTDIGASFPLPDRLWPRARTLCLSGGSYFEDQASHLVGDMDETGWTVIEGPTLNELDAWEGSTCLKFTLTSAMIPSNCSVPFLTIPLCTLQNSNVLTGRNTVIMMAKVSDVSVWEYLKLSADFYWANGEPHDSCLYRPAYPPLGISKKHVAKGWYRIEAVLCVEPSIKPSFTTPIIGLRIYPPSRNIIQIGQDNSLIHVFIGSITIFPVDWPLQVSSPQPGIAHWKPLNGPDKNSTLVWGILSWDEEETYRDSGYFDIVISVIPDLDVVSIRNVEEDGYLWLGSSTAEKQWNSFVVCGLDLMQVPNYNVTTKIVTFYAVHVGIPTEMPLYKLTMKVPGK